MNVLDLFSGIGGFSLGLEAAGMRTVAFCEIEKYPQKILKQHWPDVPIFDDVRKLTKEHIPEPIDLICGGYPCQPFSVAGKQLGAKDERHLWPEVLRLVQSIRPRWVVCENVAGHIKLGFDEVATSLENEGYTVWPFVIPACAVNAPHRRDRVWIIAHSKYNGLHATTLPRSNAAGVSRREEGQNSTEQSPRIHKPSNVANPADAGFKGMYKRKEVSFDWNVESSVGRVAHGVSKRVDRIKCLGNAVLHQIPYLIGLTIMEYEAANHIASLSPPCNS